jgi:hypothetical protein
MLGQVFDNFEQDEMLEEAVEKLQFLIRQSGFYSTENKIFEPK